MHKQRDKKWKLLIKTRSTTWYLRSSLRIPPFEIPEKYFLSDFYLSRRTANIGQDKNRRTSGQATIERSRIYIKKHIVAHSRGTAFILYFSFSPGVNSSSTTKRHTKSAFDGWKRKLLLRSCIFFRRFYIPEGPVARASVFKLAEQLGQ